MTRDPENGEEPGQEPNSSPGFFDRCAEAIEKNGFYRTLAALGALTVLGIGYAAIVHLFESDERAKARRYEAWSFLIAASGPLGDPEHDEQRNCIVANWGLIEPIQQLVEEGVDLESVNLPNVYLKGMKAPGIRLPKAQLFCATLDNSILSKADLRWAKLRDANAACVDFSGANLEGAILVDTNFRATIFKHARLKGADFTGAKFIQTDLREADLSQTKGILPDDLGKACTKKGSTKPPNSWTPKELSSFAWPTCQVDKEGKIQPEKPCD